MDKVCVLIPAYNEARKIGEVVKAVKGLGLDAVVIDDGSTDQTYELAERAGAFVIRNTCNKGKGASIREGVRFILSKPYSAMLIMDGDGQHDPGEIHKFLNKAKESGSAFIQGNRMHNPTSMPLMRLFTNKIMSAIVSGICKQNIADTQCGYKFVRRDVLEKLTLKTSKYDIESEMLIETANMRVKIDSVPIKSIYQKEESKIKPIIDTLRFVRLLINKAPKRRKNGRV